MARNARGSSRTITKPLPAGGRPSTGGKFDRGSDPGPADIMVNTNRESGPRLNPKKPG